jgi:hypothetical protein
MRFDTKGYQGYIAIDRKEGMDEEEKKIAIPLHTKVASNSFSETGSEYNGNPLNYAKRGSSSASSNVNNATLEKLDKDKPGFTVGDLDFVNYRYTHNKHLITGMLLIDDNGIISEKEGYPYWFFEGIMVSEEGFLEIARRMIESNDDIFEEVSMHSRYPIFATKINDCFRNKTHCDKLTYKGKLFTGSLHPAFYNHCYTIKDGVFIDKKPRAVTMSKYYLDQLWLRMKGGSPMQVLRDSSSKRQMLIEEVGEKADEGEHEYTLGKVKIVKREGVVSIVNVEGNEKKGMSDFKQQLTIGMMEDPVAIQKVIAEEVKESHKELQFEKKGPTKMPAIAAEDPRTRQTLEDLLGPVEEADFEELDDIAKNWDNEEFNTDVKKYFGKIPFIEDGPTLEEEVTYLQEVEEHQFRDLLARDVKRITDLIEETLLKYASVYDEKKMDNMAIAQALLALDDAKETISENVNTL